MFTFCSNILFQFSLQLWILFSEVVFYIVNPFGKLRKTLAISSRMESRFPYSYVPKIRWLSEGHLIPYYEGIYDTIVHFHDRVYRRTTCHVAKISNSTNSVPESLCWAISDSNSMVLLRICLPVIVLQRIQPLVGFDILATRPVSCHDVTGWLPASWIWFRHAGGCSLFPPPKVIDVGLSPSISPWSRLPTVQISGAKNAANVRTSDQVPYSSSFICGVDDFVSGLLSGFASGTRKISGFVDIGVQQVR